jgi:hypothetical protein
MIRLRRPRGGMFLLLLLALPWMGCSRPGSQGAADAGQHQVPFREGGQSETAGLGSTVSAAEKGSESEAGIPFRDPQSLPAGTLLTVRLKDAISSTSSGPPSTFAAVVDEPIVIEGETLVARGASAAGRVESVHSSTMNANQGYLRLSLDVVDIAGRDLPIRTSSLFARGRKGESRARDVSPAVGLEQGRRLTFRLAEPVYMASKAANPGR